MIQKFKRWFTLPFRSLRDHSVAASGVLMIKNNIGGLLLHHLELFAFHYQVNCHEQEHVQAGNKL